MLTRFSFALLIGSLLLLPSGRVSGAPPIIEVLVPGFQYPQVGVTYTKATGIANNGTVLGNTNLGSFLRYADGEFSPLFNVAGVGGTTAMGVNSSNRVCGYYDAGSGYRGFFYDGTTFDQYSVAGADDTYVLGINDAGDICGYYDAFGCPPCFGLPILPVIGNFSYPINGDSRLPTIISAPSHYTGFAVIGGTFITFSSSPDAEAVFPRAINNLGQVGGYYLAASDESYHSFFDYIYPFEPHGSTSSSINGINDRGIKVGTYTASNSAHSFVLKSPRLDISYDYPDVDLTYLTGINNSGLISGYYYDGGVYSSFIARVVR
jgi:hypothetical protein